MNILDTDVLSFYLHNPHNYPHLVERIKEADAKAAICISVIQIEEMMAGVIYEIRKASNQKPDDIVKTYSYLSALVSDLRRFIVLPFDSAACDIYRNIPRHVRSGRVNDCRLAAIALSRDYTIITNNAKDFEPIKASTGVKVEYWATAPLPSA